ncbi:aminotransferase class V-fold PLP-dependent enzyme [Micromonospora inyonensis]|uniref:aminotransferase class V-fold PLP-dependent enzyme n=1 Tax=Micromonospora inyonensis TaxID=47866 RepID=UPI00159F189B|nr:aminotransferase class V-fold PLP-dependent enzyme [Micromonospora inyonensis]
MSHLLEQYLNDENLRRRDFPVTREWAFLAHAAVAPLPRPVAEAITGYLTRAQHTGQFDMICAGLEENTRRLAANLLGVSTDEICFSPSTSASLSLVAESFDWHPGDHVVVMAGDFPSNLLPWRRLSDRGVRVTAIPYRNTPISCDEVLAEVGPGTRLVALSTANFATGRPVFDLPTVAAELHRRGVLVAVDAIQTLGVTPVDARQVDFLAADGHKWLLAPKGMGILYVRRDRLAEMRPPLVGWHSTCEPKRYVGEAALADSARRFEPGSLNMLGLVGLHAALSLLDRVGIDAVNQRLDRVRRGLVEGLLARGYDVPGAPARRWSGITSFRRPGTDTSMLAASLLAHRVAVSVRAAPDGHDHVRLAPHFYTTDADLARLWEVL